jgi:hypothetical protein
MMARFCAYVEKVFHFSSLLKTLHEPRLIPVIPIGSIFTSAWALFATARCSLHSLEKDLVRFPSRLRGIVGPHPPSSDTIGRVFAAMDPEPPIAGETPTARPGGHALSFPCSVRMSVRAWA